MEGKIDERQKYFFCHLNNANWNNNSNSEFCTSAKKPIYLQALQSQKSFLLLCIFSSHFSIANCGFYRISLVVIALN
jgi:hypothetical protein